jgi:hypothetical protein
MLVDRLQENNGVNEICVYHVRSKGEGRPTIQGAMFSFSLFEKGATYHVSAKTKTRIKNSPLARALDRGPPIPRNP